MLFSTQVVKIDRARLWTSPSANSDGEEDSSGLANAVGGRDTAEPEEEEDHESDGRLHQALDEMLESSLDLGSFFSKGDEPEDGVAPADKVAKKKRKARKKKLDSNPGMFILWEAARGRDCSLTNC